MIRIRFEGEEDEKERRKDAQKSEIFHPNRRSTQPTLLLVVALQVRFGYQLKLEMSMSEIPMTPVKLHKVKGEKKEKHKEKEGKKSKKRKEFVGGDEEPMQVDEEPTKKKHKHKHQPIDTLGGLGNEFICTKSSLMLSIPPIYTNNPLNGAIGVLDGLVMRYVLPFPTTLVITHFTTVQLRPLTIRYTPLSHPCPFPNTNGSRPTRDAVHEMRSPF